MGRHLALLFCLAGLLPAGAAANPAARPASPTANTLSLELDTKTFGPVEPIALYFDQRLTFVMPGPVSLAVPGSPDVVSANIRDNIVVVNLVDSAFVRKRRPQTNLTILSADGTPFTCRLEVARSAADVRYDLVKVARGPGHRLAVSADAARLLKTWLEQGADAVDPAHAAQLEALEPQLQRRARSTVAGWVASAGFEASPNVVRSKKSFIYLTSHGLARVGTMGVVHLSVTNHSQAPFSVASVRVFSGETAVAADQVEVQMPDALVPPDGAPRGIGVVAPLAVLGENALYVEVCEDTSAPRCVRVRTH